MQKIVQDHNGEIFVERTAQGKTVFRIVLPGRLKETFRTSIDPLGNLASLVPAQQDNTSAKLISRPGP